MIAGGLYWLLVPKITGMRAGIPTNRVIEVTSLAMVLELGIFLNNTRSKISPRPGATTTTAMRNATQIGRFSFWTRRVKRKAETNACAPKAKLNTPVAW